MTLAAEYFEFQIGGGGSGTNFDLFDIRFEFVGSGRPMTELASLRIINI